jgi:hypothetical protein
LIFVIEMFCIFFEVRTEFLNIIYMSFSFRELTNSLCDLQKLKCKIVKKLFATNLLL